MIIPPALGDMILTAFVHGDERDGKNNRRQKVINLV
jgi:hypothetical protein